MSTHFHSTWYTRTIIKFQPIFMCVAPCSFSDLTQGCPQVGRLWNNDPKSNTSCWVLTYVSFIFLLLNSIFCIHERRPWCESGQWGQCPTSDSSEMVSKSTPTQGPSWMSSRRSLQNIMGNRPRCNKHALHLQSRHTLYSQASNRERQRV